MSEPKNPYFCILPWVHMSVHQTGTVHPCCRTHPDFVYGNLKNQTQDEIWNSPNARKMRQALLQAEAQPHCCECYATEKLGETSYRQLSNAKYSKSFSHTELTAPDGSLRKVDAIYFDFRFSNLCNLRCRTCEPLSSTSWYAESALIHGKAAPRSTIQLPLDQTKLDLFFNQLIPKLEEAHILGGEPMLQPEHYFFLEKLISAGRTDILLSYNTNLTRLRLKNKSVLKLWMKFKNVFIDLSFDGVGDQLELMRKGARWQVLKRNFRLIRLFAPHVKFRVYPAISVMNCFHLTRAVEEWIDLKMICDQESPLKFNFVDWPRYYSIGILNPEESNALASHYKLFFSRLRTQVSESLCKKIESEFLKVLARAGSIDNEIDKLKARQDFKRISLTLDQSRNESLRRLFPELSSLLN